MKKKRTGFSDLEGEKRVRIDAVGFLQMYLVDTELSQSEVARRLKTTRQNLNRYCKSGGHLSEDWLCTLAESYPKGSRAFWDLVQDYC